MTENKSQHFVSRMVLRNFAHGESKKLIRLYRLPAGPYAPHAPIKSQACEDYFYEKGKEVEDALAEMENQMAPRLKRIVTNGTLPKWGSREHRDLLIFVLSQSSRTRASTDEAIELLEMAVGKAAEISRGANPGLNTTAINFDGMPVEMLKLSLINSLAAVDLRYQLLRNGTKTDFVTSDHPVVIYNQFCERENHAASGTGIGCRGLQIFLPLDPRHILILFDRAIYKVGRKDVYETCVDVADEDDVRQMNTLQVVNGGEHLYFSDATTEAYAERLVRKARRYMRNERGSARTAPAVFGGMECGPIIAITQTDVRIGLDLHCVKIMPSAKNHLPAYAGAHLRDPILVQLVSEFGLEVRAGRLKFHEFNDFCDARRREKGK